MIYLDSCLLIYQVEPNPVWSPVLQATLAPFLATGVKFAVSPLVKAECLIHPLRNNDPTLERSYRSAFDQYVTLDMPEPVFLDCAGIRARHRMKIPDALHLACARHHGCTELWTNDTRLSAAGGRLIRTLSPP